MVKGNIIILSIDTEYNIINDDEIGIGSRKELFSISIVAIDVKSVIRKLNNPNANSNIHVYSFPMYNEKWHSDLSDFWLNKQEELKSCVYSGPIDNYRDLCKSVRDEVKSVIEKYRNKGDVKIIAGVSADADIIRTLDNDIFNIRSEIRNIYIDPIIVKSLFSSVCARESVNPYTLFYKNNKKAGKLFNDLVGILIGKTHKAHNSDYDAILNACNFLAFSNYII